MSDRAISSVDCIDAFGDRVICDQCGARISTYGDLCSVPLDVRCQGFDTYEMMLAFVGEKRGPQGLIAKEGQ